MPLERNERAHGQHDVGPQRRQVGAQAKFEALGPANAQQPAHARNKLALLQAAHQRHEFGQPTHPAGQPEQARFKLPAKLRQERVEAGQVLVGLFEHAAREHGEPDARAIEVNGLLQNRVVGRLVVDGGHGRHIGRKRVGAGPGRGRRGRAGRKRVGAGPGRRWRAGHTGRGVKDFLGAVGVANHEHVGAPHADERAVGVVGAAVAHFGGRDFHHFHGDFFAVALGE